MGYNSKCQIQDCRENCCNYYGYCPQTSSTSTFISQCQYYYNNNGAAIQLSTGVIVAIVFASALVAFLIGLLIWKIVKKCQIYQSYSVGVARHQPQIMTTQNELEYKQPNKMEQSMQKCNETINNSTQPPSIQNLPPLKASTLGMRPVVVRQFKQYSHNPLSFIQIEP